MDHDQPPLIAEPANAAADRSLTNDVRQLADDARGLLEAELAYQKSRAAVAGVGLRGVAAWVALALALAFFALMALVIGLLLALSPLIGGWGAMATVTVALVLLAGSAGWAAARRWKRMAMLLAEPDGATQDDQA